MKPWLMAGTLGLALLAAPSTRAREPLDPVLKRNGWYGDYRQARQAAGRSGKLLFVVFRCQP